MSQKLIRIVYDYDLHKDRVVARHEYDDAEPQVIEHTRQEWEDLLYDIRNTNQPVELVKAMDLL